MFTGLVQALGILSRVNPTDTGKRLTVSLAELAIAPISPGDSVCVSGVCLTVVDVANGNAHFDVITETLNRSTLGRHKIADRLNLELSLRPDSFVGGHFVQGHVDAIGTVAAVHSTREDWRITIEAPAEHMGAIVPKGSVTVDGVSMTIAAVDNSKHTFTIAVIPTTLERTTLGTLLPGHGVNIETDILARTVVHWLQLQRDGGKPTPRQHPSELIASLRDGGVTMQKLTEHGFA
jgi:riboflavin synthase